MEDERGRRRSRRSRWDTSHLQVPVDDGCLALVQAGHGLAGVAEDVEDLGLAEAHVEPLVHLLDHLARCGRRREEEGGGEVRGLHAAPLKRRLADRSSDLEALPLQYSMRISTSQTLSDTALMVESRYPTMFLWPDSSFCGRDKDQKIKPVSNINNK